MYIQGKKWKKDYSKMEHDELVKEYEIAVNNFVNYVQKYQKLLNESAGTARIRLAKHRMEQYNQKCKEIEFYLY